MYVPGHQGCLLIGRDDVDRDQAQHVAVREVGGRVRVDLLIAQRANEFSNEKPSALRRYDQCIILQACAWRQLYLNRIFMHVLSLLCFRMGASLCSHTPVREHSEVLPNGVQYVLIKLSVLGVLPHGSAVSTAACELWVSERGGG